MLHVLMVCLGNICRSPAAEAVLRQHLEREGLADKIVVESAGTIDLHAGQPADGRMRRAAGSRGYALTGTARGVTDRDPQRFDLILAMDRQNLRDLQPLTLQPGSRADLVLLGHYVPTDDEPDVPDPYYGGDDGFERVLDLLESAMPRLLDDLRSRLRGQA